VFRLRVIPSGEAGRREKVVIYFHVWLAQAAPRASSAPARSARGRVAARSPFDQAACHCVAWLGLADCGSPPCRRDGWRLYGKLACGRRRRGSPATRRGNLVSQRRQCRGWRRRWCGHSWRRAIVCRVPVGSALRSGGPAGGDRNNTGSLTTARASLSRGGGGAAGQLYLFQRGPRGIERRRPARAE
jgi:hypothetical protein